MLLTITNSPPRTLRQALALLFAMSLAASAAHAQYTPPPPPLTTKPCVPTKKDPCDVPAATGRTAPAAPDGFAFPDETPSPSSKPTPPHGAQPPTSQAFPFPGESDAIPPAAPKAPPTSQAFPFPSDPGAPASSSSSSSSSSSDPDPTGDLDKPALADKGSSGSTRAQRRHLPKVEDMDHREEEDLDVSHYYMTTGNFLGAYMRAQDAVKTIPNDPMAHFALAETASKMNKKDEAIAEYLLYLKLDPDGDKAKAAELALALLTQK